MKPARPWMSPVGRTLATVITLGLVEVSAPLDAAGQQIFTGRVVEEGTDRPVAAAFLVVSDDVGRQVVAGLADADGRFRLQARPAEGSYTVRAERLGYGGAESTPVFVAAGETLDVTLALPTAAVALEAIEAVGVRRCDVDAEEGLRIHELWDEARKALEIVAWTDEGEGLRFRGRRYEQVWTGRVDEERSRIVDSGDRPPFFSEPARSLIEEGYVRPVGRGEAFDYFGPDARVVLSDEFLEAYCFRLRGPPRGGDELVGLAFEPLEPGGLPDITGVLWLEDGSARPRALEFQYTDHLLEPSIPRDLHPQFGGRVEFRKLPGGAWVTDRWRLRMPQYQTMATVFPYKIPPWWIGGYQEVEDLPPVARKILTHLGVKEVGGELAMLETAEGVELLTPALAVLDGVAFDSTRMAPLGRARVELLGTPYRASADSDGRFRVAEPTEGVYDLQLHHPCLDRLGIEALTREVELVRGEVREVRVAVPSWGPLLAAACPAPGPGAGVVVGVVRDRSSGGALSGANVRLRDPAARADDADLPRSARTDEDGVFRFCGVPAARELVLEADLLGRGAEALPVRVSEERPAYRELELRLGSASRIVGVVLDDATDRPLAGASVRRAAGAEARTADAAGRFRFDDVEPGEHELEVAHMGYGTATGVVEVEETGTTYQVEVRLDQEAIAMEPLKVVTRRPTGGPLDEVRSRLEWMERLGLGRFMRREAIDRSGATRLSHLLQRFPGVRLHPHPRRAGGYRVELTRSRGLDEVCDARIYVDGLAYGLAGDEAVDDIVSPTAVEILEVYRSPAELPIEFGGSEDRCGVVAVWTRGGG